MPLNANLRASAAAALTLTLALAACGGGGGSPNTAEPPLPPPAPLREAPLPLSAANIVDASTFGLGYGELALGLAQHAIDWIATVDTATELSVTTVCGAGGSQTVTLLDRDGNRRASAGDQVTVTLTACYLKLLEDALDGTLTIDIAAPGALQQQAGSIAFGTTLGSTLDGVTLGLEGGLRYEYASDRLSKTVRVLSAAQAFGITGSAGTVKLSDQVTLLDARRESRRDTARASTTIRFHLASDILGGSVDVATATPWSAWFDSYPDAGSLTISGAASRTAELRASSTGGNQLDVLLDGAAAATVAVDDASGYLWSGAAWIAPDNSALRYMNRPASETGFRLLSQPGLATLQPKTGPLVWAYSRPLAAGTLTSAKFVRMASGSGPDWAPAEIAADLQIEGALLTVTPTAQLEPGNSYALIFDNSYVAPIADASGATTQRPELSAPVALTISASARVEAPGLLLGSGAALVLDATASSAAGTAVAATQWRQISGPALSFSGADTPRATVTLAAAGNGEAVVEVEVSNATGEIDRQQVRFPVLGEFSQALVIAYRVGSAPMQVYTSADPGSPETTVRYFATYNSLDVVLGWGRLLSSLPVGVAWQTGTEFIYGSPAPGGANVVWLPPSGGQCSAKVGKLSVLDYAIDGAGTVTRLAIDFEETCDSTVTTFGSVRYNSALPLRP